MRIKFVKNGIEAIKQLAVCKKETDIRVPGSNSTSISTSLSGPKSSRSIEPKSDNLRTWFCLQKLAILSLGILIFGSLMDTEPQGVLYLHN